jgi:bacillithiol biosynthesis cysteine-adding enzyme BshC
MAERPTVLDYGALRDPPSTLFRDYVAGAPGVARFYADGWSLDAVAESAAAARAVRPHAGEVARALAAQQRARGAARAAERALELERPDAAAVVTGQQPVLFGGPLFVLYKALGAVMVAERLAARRSAPVVPVFWVASDDHDFAEVRSVSVLDEAGQIRTLRYAPAREPSGQPAAQIVFDDTLPGLVQDLERTLPAGPHRDALLARVSACYRPGATVSGAFAALLSSLFPELVVLDAADPALKAAMAPVFRREVAERSPTSRLAAEVGAALLAAGYHQQVPVRPGFLSLFLIDGGERHALALTDSHVEVRGLGRLIPLAEAERLAAEQPALWSPGVLLRPLAQDLMLPTAAYLAGPAEVAYHAQIGPSYAHFGVRRPALVPRPSVTVVEPGQARVLAAEGLELTDLEGDPEDLRARWAREDYPQVEAAFTRTRGALRAGMKEVEEALAALDPTLRAAADAALGRALHPIDGLQEKSLRALKKRDQSRADRLRRTRDALFPGGGFQERGLGLAWLLARQGEAVLGALAERIDPWARGHQVVYL